MASSEASSIMKSLIVMHAGLGGVENTSLARVVANALPDALPNDGRGRSGLIACEIAMQRNVELFKGDERVGRLPPRRRRSGKKRK